ncbi:putative eukaryotic translation initiation factor 3 subunit 7 [Gregarina niphandrodes]|uniref:Eukaryotic translation initiation factor 3 subunit 7 n=1 Tax=Gregarina niphandrodes TaxID=110365 RepID=A0A023B9D0_GRENI|nr:putative eukaryotic translation initiation factor 3 subunit 7 [Gregarina niphandrodes]EZG72703.1 putative eukaryotic translation initiation factor 3 subunit 7 [Gregarina niphandrodes]|eukprot:XP_011129761.1 putative eukaryotic translation initiation factor 3 subunit 7 [Gregarina niphandrodes]
MAGIQLPPRLRKEGPLSAMPVPLARLEESEVPRSILHDPFMFLGPSLNRSNCSRVCDFTYWTAQKQQFVQKPRTAMDTEFVTVDSKKVASKPPAYKKNVQNTYVQRPPQQRSYQSGGKKDKLSAAYQRPQPVNRFAVMRARAVVGEYACPIEPEWEHVTDASLQLLNGATINPKTVLFEDIKFVGRVRHFNKQIELITPQTSVDLPLKYTSLGGGNMSHHIPGTRGDPILSELIMDENAGVQVIVTDQLLSTLMAATLSKFGWQIDVYKFENKLILEKSELTENLDLLTINENVAIEHMGDSKQREAARESALIQVEFQQYALTRPDGSGLESIAAVGQEEEIEFEEEWQVPERFYRYRYITLPPGRPIPGHQGDHCRKQPIKMAVRGELHCAQTNADGAVEEYLTVHSLNEGLIKLTGEPWASGLERQKGALLLSEMRKNNCKMSKWLYASIVAGANSMKIGFISKRTGDNRILTVQTSRIGDLVVQTGLKMANGWGTIRELLDIILSDNREGRFIITKDALGETIRIHHVSVEVESED